MNKFGMAFCFKQINELAGSPCRISQLSIYRNSYNHDFINFPGEQGLAIHFTSNKLMNSKLLPTKFRKVHITKRTYEKCVPFVDQWPEFYTLNDHLLKKTYLICELWLNPIFCIVDEFLKKLNGESLMLWLFSSSLFLTM